MPCLRHTRLKVVLNAKLKARSWGNSLCEVLTPVALVALFAWLYTLVDISTMPDATFECDALHLHNQRHDMVYLPRMLAATGQKIAVVGDAGVTGDFLAHLAAWYPGLPAAVVAPLQCAELDTEAPLQLPAFFPDFAASMVTFPAEAAMEAYVRAPDYGSAVDKPQLYAAVVFTSTGGPTRSRAGAWSYRLRLNMSDTPVTWAPGSQLARDIQPQYVQNYVASSPAGGGVSGGPSSPSLKLSQMWQAGFVPLQLAVDRFILNTSSAGVVTSRSSGLSPAGRERLLQAIDGVNAWFARSSVPLSGSAAKAAAAAEEEEKKAEWRAASSSSPAAGTAGSCRKRGFSTEGVDPARLRRLATSLTTTLATAPPPSASNVSDVDRLAFFLTWLCDNTTALADPGTTAAMSAFFASHSLLPQEVAVSPFPRKSFVTNGFFTLVSNVFALAFCLGFFPAAFGLIRGIVGEKEAKLREGIRMMGYSDSALVASWYITYGAIFTAISAIIAVLCKASLFAHSSFGYLFALFFCFGMSALSLCWAISTLFSRAKLAAIVGSTLFVAGIFPYFSVAAQTEPLASKTAAALLSPTAFGLALDIIASLEGNGAGIRPDTAFDDGYTGYTFASALSMIVFDTFLYALLAWFLHHTWPQEFGVQKQPWFLCTRSYWTGHGTPDGHADGSGGRGICAGGPLQLLSRVLRDGPSVLLRRKDSVTGSNLLDGEDRDAESGSNATALVAGGVGYEQPGAHLTAMAQAQRSISIRGLRKVFPTPDGPKTAVAGIDLDFFEGQITCLLGHNGAGKTTTISMLTGLIPPSSGRVTVFGKDISTDLASIRHSMGVCPQHDVLWADLTVSEHLRFFAGIKGVPPAEVEGAIAQAVKEVGLTEKVNARSKQLSGGQKRKLSVAIALVGGSKICVLDEPTSGMDPYSRRSTWEALQNARSGRVMLLTTHFMDEADLLGDRIAIMAQGQVKCCGSSMFLKKLYDVGYALTLVKAPGCAVEEIRSIVARHVPAGRLTSNVGAELSFRLPLDASAAFPALFTELEAGGSPVSGGTGRLGFTSYGISVTSLEDVFLKVAEESEGTPPGLVDNTAGTPAGSPIAAAATSSMDADDDGPLGGGGKAGAAAAVGLLSEERRRKAYGTDSPSRSGSADTPSKAAGALLPSRAGSVEKNLAAAFSGAGEGGGQFGAGQVIESDWATFWGHFKALVLKRFRIALRDRRAQIFQLLIPVTALGAGLALLKSGQTAAFPAMPLTLATYNQKMPHVGLGGTQANFVPIVADPAGGAGLLPYITAAGNIPGGANAGVGAAYGASLVALDAGVVDAQYGPAAYAAANGGATFPCNVSAAPWDPYDGAAMPYLQYLYPSDAFAGNLTHAWGLSQWLLDHRNGSQGTGSPGDAAREYGASRYGAFRIESMAPNPAAGPLPAGAGAYLAYQVQTNTTMWHALPTFINVLHSGLLAWVTGSNASSISITNAPLPYTALQNTAITSVQSFVAVLLMVIAVAFIPPTFAVSLVKEREVGARHQQIISGVSLSSFWLSTYAWDIANYLVPYTVFLVLIWSFGIADLTTGASGAATALLLLFYGLSVAPFTYIMTFAFQSHSSAQTFSLIFNLMAVILLIASFVMQQINSSNICTVDSSLKFVYRLFPGFALGNGLMQLSLLKQLPFLESGCGSVPYVQRMNKVYQPFDMVVTGWSILFMAVESVAYIGIAYGIEVALSYPSLRAKLLPDRDRRNPAAALHPGSEGDDADVVAEAQRVDAGGAAADVVIFRHLRKVYGGAKVAVRDLTLGIPGGETFGLLGINGAGKTTSLKCLSGDVLPTSGTASVSGFDILTQQPQVRRLLGYCPQFDALLELLTVREHLELFAAIKRIPPADVNRVVADKIREMDLAAYENKLAGTLSGGNKRKLSVAIATVGSRKGSILIFDEPTTGVDPATKRKLWRVMARIAAGGTSIILVSHSMEECEALCHRIGIAVGGRLRCLGSPQHLKHRFGRGYLGVLKLRVPSEAAVAAVERAVRGALGGRALVAGGDVPNVCRSLGAPERASQISADGSGWALDATIKDAALGGVEPGAFAVWWAAEDAVAAAERFVGTSFPGSQLVERHGELLRFTITKTSPPQPLSAVFSAFEGAVRPLGLAEYSISEPSLEDVFNLLASQQEEETHAGRGMLQPQAPGGAAPRV